MQTPFSLTPNLKTSSKNSFKSSSVKSGRILTCRLSSITYKTLKELVFTGFVFFLLIASLPPQDTLSRVQATYKDACSSSNPIGLNRRCYLDKAQRDHLIYAFQRKSL